jgi:hypothetical protein
MSAIAVVQSKRRFVVYAIIAGIMVIFVLALFSSLPSFPRSGLVPLNEFSACSLEIHEAVSAYELQYGALPPTSSNREFIAALSGNNPEKVNFLREVRQHLNWSGELVDQWGTPVRFETGHKYPIRMISAGPDKIFGTPDDISGDADLTGEK